MAIGERQQRMQDREDDVHIRHVEELPFTGVQPALARLRLTLGAVPVPTRVIGEGLMSARAAGVHVSAEGRGPAAHDGTEHRSLLHAQPRMLLDEGGPLRVEDIGHLHGGTVHGAAAFRSSRDRWCAAPGKRRLAFDSSPAGGSRVAAAVSLDRQSYKM